MRGTGYNSDMDNQRIRAELAEAVKRGDAQRAIAVAAECRVSTRAGVTHPVVEAVAAAAAAGDVKLADAVLEAQPAIADWVASKAVAEAVASDRLEYALHLMIRRRSATVALGQLVARAASGRRIDLLELAATHLAGELQGADVLLAIKNAVGTRDPKVVAAACDIKGPEYRTAFQRMALVEALATGARELFPYFVRADNRAGVMLLAALKEYGREHRVERDSVIALLCVWSPEVDVLQALLGSSWLGVQMEPGVVDAIDTYLAAQLSRDAPSDGPSDFLEMP